MCSYDTPDVLHVTGGPGVLSHMVLAQALTHSHIHYPGALIRKGCVIASCFIAYNVTNNTHQTSGLFLIKSMQVTENNSKYSYCATGDKAKILHIIGRSSATSLHLSKCSFHDKTCQLQTRVRQACSSDFFPHLTKYNGPIKVHAF